MNNYYWVLGKIFFIAHTVTVTSITDLYSDIPSLLETMVGSCAEQCLGILISLLAHMSNTRNANCLVNDLVEDSAVLNHNSTVVRCQKEWPASFLQCGRSLDFTSLIDVPYH